MLLVVAAAQVVEALYHPLWTRPSKQQQGVVGREVMVEEVGRMLDPCQPGLWNCWEVRQHHRLHATKCLERRACVCTEQPGTPATLCQQSRLICCVVVDMTGPTHTVNCHPHEPRGLDLAASSVISRCLIRSQCYASLHEPASSLLNHSSPNKLHSCPAVVDGELPAELQKHDPRLIEQVCNEVIDSGGKVAWEDIAGLHTAKDLIKEIVVWPMLNPHIFTVRAGLLKHCYIAYTLGKAICSWHDKRPRSNRQLSVKVHKPDWSTVLQDCNYGCTFALVV